MPKKNPLPPPPAPIQWISSTDYRERNGGHKGPQSPSTFYLLVRQGRLAQPKFPFGPTQPRWLLSEVEAAERSNMEAAAMDQTPFRARVNGRYNK